MGAIAQLKSATLVTQSLVRQAILEAKQDPAQMSVLQEALDCKCSDEFESEHQFHMLQQMVQDWACDRFELRPNTDNRVPARATITEARITKVQEHKQEVVINPPAEPVNPGRYRDPLHITGQAEPGATVEVYNASVEGRVVIATTTADATGKFRVELTDESKFSFGDQMGVVVSDAAGKKSRPVLVPTEPFMVTNTTTTYFQYRGGPVVRTDVTSNMAALDRATDVRDPFYKEGKVQPTFAEPHAAGEPWTMTLKGGDDAVEPNSTVTVRVGGEVFTSKVADDGTFALKVAGFVPGQTLSVEVRDLNGKGVNRQIKVPNLALQANSMAAAMTSAPTLTPPTGAREVLGNTAPWGLFKAEQITVPFGAVVVKNQTSGEVLEMSADAQGSISAAVGGLSEFDVLQVAVRDANGNFSDKTLSMVVLPDRTCGSFLVPVGQLGGTAPALDKVLEAITGPPMDLFVQRGATKVKDPKGPFLAMAPVRGLPPYGQVAVVRDGKVVQTMRADANGVVKGYLRGVTAGDRLDFRVLDAAGRRFPEEIVGFEVPGPQKKTTIKPENRHTPSDARSIKDCVDRVGTGTLDVEHAWIQPVEIGAQQDAPKDDEFKLLYAPLVFGGMAADAQGGVPKQLIESLPKALAEKFGVGNVVNIVVQDNNGTQMLVVNPNSSTNRCTVGVDFAQNTVNAGGFSSPLTQAHLPSLTAGLKASLALVAAAYDQGKEPGDLVYDRAIAAAKTILYVLDRFATANPTLVAEAKKAAVDGFPADFPFELFAQDRVAPSTQQTPLAEVSGKRTGTLSLVEARQASLGRVEAKPTQPEPGLTVAPRVEQAAILRAGGNMSASTIVVSGRGTAGDVVQVFNVSAGKNVLVGEVLVQPDGQYSMMAMGQAALGDQLGVVALSSSKLTRSRMNLVRSAGYQWNGADLKTARLQRHDERPPQITPSAFTLKNASYEASGQVRAGGPFWTLDGGDFSVEPFATVTVTGKKANGTDVVVKKKADAEGKFSLEFPFPARSLFSVQVNDINGSGAQVQLQTPGLSETQGAGGRSMEKVMGVVVMKLGALDVKGVVVENSLTDNREALRIDDASRSDGFVDVLLEQRYAARQASGSSREFVVRFRVKVAAAEAGKLAAGVNDQLDLRGAAVEDLNFNDADVVGYSLKGPARILDRDHLPLPT